MNIIIAYIPVLHNGYFKLLHEYGNSENDLLCLLSREVVDKFGFPEIRALDPYLMSRALENLFSGKVLVWGFEGLKRRQMMAEADLIVLPEEELSHNIVKHYLGGPGINNKVRFFSTWLRWEESSVSKKEPVNFDRKSCEESDLRLMALAKKQGQESSDWWRQVGAVIVKDGEIILSANNHHLPSDQTPYINGDPRDCIKAGTASEMASAVHAEQALIAEAASRGVSLAGSDIYVSVFPCPMCAKSIALAGIRRCFFGSGHASLDGESILKQKGVELIWVSE